MSLISYLILAAWTCAVVRLVGSRATIDDPAIIQRFLAHLGLPGARAGPPPPAAAANRRALAWEA
jgi:hypothetical protein